MANWQDKLSCFSPNYIEHTVVGQKLHFYPVSVGMAFKLRTIGRPLAKSLTVLFSSNDNDHGTKDIQVQNDQGGQDRQIIIEPITDGLARIRHDQKIEAVDSLIEALTSDENAKVMADIFMDSLREEFPPEKPNERPPGLEFMAKMPIAVLGGMSIGVMQANKDVFGPLTEKVAQAASAAVEKVVGERTAAVEQATAKVAEAIETKATTTPDAPATSPENEPPTVAGTISPATSG